MRVVVAVIGIGFAVGLLGWAIKKAIEANGK